jgi:hypothetical protein
MIATPQPEMTWALGSGDGKVGTGNWRAFRQERLPELFAAAADWKRELAGIEKPWLCWCLDEDWCLTQQQLVRAAGWTPVVGTDGHVRMPRLIRCALFVDFNRTLQLPLMWMHFPLEFVFLFADRLAFWHSDVLPPFAVMRALAERFEGLPNGAMAAVRRERVTWGERLRRLAKRKPMFYKRWFEVVGCTTAAASRSQFENGCGWWRYPRLHPHAKPWTASAYQREHGVGIWFWMTHCHGDVRDVGCDIDPYHYSTSKKGYLRRWKDAHTLDGSKRHELNDTFDLRSVRRTLGLELDNDR